LKTSRSRGGSIISFIKKIEEKVHPTPLREKIAQAIYKLTAQKEKLTQTTAKLQQRDQEMFQRCIGAHLAKDSAHASIYASECAEVRKMFRIVLSSQLALERVILRLQTIEEFGDLLMQIAPVVGVVKETKRRIGGIIPEVASELEGIHEMLSDTVIETGEVEAKSLTLEACDEEVKKILEQSSIIAEQRIKERFPELPTFIQESSIASEPIAIGIGEDGGEEIALEQQVFDYIKQNKGRLSISKCASDLHTSREEIKRIVEKLKREGKIVLA
jgi:division protein CdvB (Snf7/Vps24/ESCRT-III family)